MPLGLLCAFGTSLCYGVGSVLQAAAAGNTASAGGLDPRLLLKLARTWRYPAGLALDGAGFVLSLVALRSLPLYVVQSVVASFLAVTAVVSVAFLGVRLGRSEMAALAAVVVGLTLVGLSAAPQPAHRVGATTAWALLAVTVLLVAAFLLRPRRRPPSAWVLGGAAGVAFGLVAVAVRALPPVSGLGTGDLRALVASPALYAVVAATPFALTAYAAGLQQGTVVQATAPLVVGETVLPALVGLVLFGDHPRPGGWGALAALGFVLAVGASLVLSRYGDVETTGHGS